MLFSYKGNSRPFDTVIQFINHIIVILGAKICVGLFNIILHYSCIEIEFPFDHGIIRIIK